MLQCRYVAVAVNERKDVWRFHITLTALVRLLFSVLVQFVAPGLAEQHSYVNPSPAPLSLLSSPPCRRLRIPCHLVCAFPCVPQKMTSPPLAGNSWKDTHRCVSQFLNINGALLVQYIDKQMSLLLLPQPGPRPETPPTPLSGLVSPASTLSDSKREGIRFYLTLPHWPLLFQI